MKKISMYEKLIHGLWHGSGLGKFFKIRGPWRSNVNKRDARTIWVVFLFSLFVAGLAFVGWFDASVIKGVLPQNLISASRTIKLPKEYPLQCTMATTNKSTPTPTNTTQSCPKDYYPKTHNPKTNPNQPTNDTCPEYFRWIHEDLRHWRETGITRDMIERARRNAHFRLIVVDGKAYVEKFRKSLQTRDEFTLWGILQLMRWYPGRLPDLELLFDCDDRPVVRAKDFRRPNSGPPPLFRYCSDPWSLDIVFPDWSFWGWAETNIRPWRNVLKDIKEGNKRTTWKDRVPYAYWRGNPNVCPSRQDLLKCNFSNQFDWNTRLYIQNWEREAKQGYKQSSLEDQCTYRYKIYIEGWAWSVSEKYILACDSMTMYVTPRFYDFFIRGMAPLKHYWPIRDRGKCPSLKFAVDWGNNHTHEAQAIGEAASKFIQEDMKMEYIYDYMFHLLNEYAKLLKFKPTVPPEATELCSETMACARNGTHKRFMMESMVMSPSNSIPCNLPPPYDPQSLRQILDRNFKTIKQVEMWEDEYWQKQKQAKA